jgi:hypothetical protein
MSKTDKIRKLANAIRRYRGVTSTPADAVKPKWRHAPCRSAEIDCKRWLEELCLDVPKSMTVIESFNNFEEFNTWLKRLNPQNYEHTN